MNPLSRRLDAPNTFRFGLYGKVPQAGDFLSYGPADGAAEVFRSWLEHGVSWPLSRRPDVWRQALEQPRVFALVFRAPLGQLVVGALRPSRDAAERHFPLSAYAIVDAATLSGRPHVAPLSFGDLLQHMADVVLAPEPLQAIAGVEGALTPGGAAPFFPFEEDLRQYATWAEATSLAGAWTAVLGAEPSLVQAHAVHAVHTIWEAILPWQGREEPPTPLSVRVPLGSAGVGAGAFWIDIARRAAGWQSTVPTVFWSVQDGSGEALLQLGDVPPSSLCELWVPNPESDHVCDLTRPSAVDVGAILARLPPGLAAALSRGDGNVADFMMAFQR
ncbi:MAG TPA: type VI secretion system-associated protein TagF [Polyangiaceae bacterium]|jgi:type VI secretion system ImpM family protein